jgi:hypothetical protein
MSSIVNFEWNIKNIPLFSIFMICGTAIVFFSAPGTLTSSWGRIARIALYLLPFAATVLVLGPLNMIDKTDRTTLLLLTTVFALAIPNLILSENPSQTLLSLITFLTTGLLTIWVSSLLFREARLVNAFDLASGLLLVCVLLIELNHIKDLVLYSGFNPLWIGATITGNSIPFGTLLILLSSPALRLLSNKTWQKRVSGLVLLSMSFVMILLTQRRGSVLAFVVMIGIYLFINIKKNIYKYMIVACVCLGLVILSIRLISGAASLDPSKPRDFSVLVRMECYSFALHVWQEKPFFGVGARSSSYDNHLADYKRSIPRLTDFDETIKRLQTLDNMYVTLMVEFGSLFGMAYLGLLAYTVYRFRKSENESDLWQSAKIRAPVLIALAVQAVTYDALIHPAINWLFSAHMGILAAASDWIPLSEGKE